MIAVPRREQALDGAAIRAEFPALARPMRGRPLIYLDSAATTQRPRAVIDAVAQAYEEGCAGMSRLSHQLGDRARESYAHARTIVSRFLGARSPREIVFTSSGTSAIARVAELWGAAHVTEGDELVVTELEHSANLVPWILLAERVGARVRVAPVTPEGELDLVALERLLGPRTRLVAVTHVSHVHGGITPVRRVADLVHAAGALLLVDGAQAAGRLEVDVAELGADFYCLSGHKLYGPSGTGVLWAKGELLAELPAARGGSSAVTDVYVPEHGRPTVTWAEAPERFEGGEPNVAGAVGLAAGLAWLDELDRRATALYEQHLVEYALERLSEVPGLSLVGTPRARVGAIAFVMGTVQAHDVAMVLDARGIAVSAGHHGAHLFAARTGLSATVRASFGVYTTRQEVDALAHGLRLARELFA